MTVTCSVIIGTTNIPATVVSDEPRTQLSTAIEFDEMPTADAACSFSDTASVASPKLLERYNSHRPTADKQPRARSTMRSKVIPTSDHKISR